MKKYFKKSLAVFMAMLMLLSVVGVSAMAATYTIKFAAGNNGTVISSDPAPIIVDGKVTITLPGLSYTRDGYVQAGWSNVRAGNRKVGDLGGTYSVTRSLTLYPYWEAVKYTVKFAPGAYGTGTEFEDEVSYNASIAAPGEIFTRDGFFMVGWSSVDGGEKEFDVNGRIPNVLADVTYYPVWEKCDYTVNADVSYMNFGSICVDYKTPDAKDVTITNDGNVTLNFTLPTVNGFNIVKKSGNLALTAGSSLVISIQPKAGLDVGNYSSKALIACDYADSSVEVDLAFIVNEHSFDKYTSDNNATYEADGTKTAECSNGCGCSDTIIDLGSMKVYKADNNTVEGLLKEYLYHKTVRVTAYGSGTDNIQADGSIAPGTKRYRPVSWYVNDEFNGEFKDGNYDINFVHTSFGDYTLTINYVEEVYTCDNHTGPHYFCEDCGELTGEKCEFCGQDTLALVCDICNDPTCGNVLFEDESEKTFGWVATGEEDEKSFDYYVGPNEKEEQEVVRPNMIVSIIFGLFAKLFELLFG